MAALVFDRDQILQTWRIFRQPGEVLELRVPKAGRYKTISGYFDDPAKLADAAVGLADEKFAGIYFTINPVKPELLARASNRYVKYAETTTSDADIIALHWLPIDLDAKRPAGISATDGEHDAAINKAREIRRWLIEELGWPAGAFVLADSGNGGHLNIKIDLPNVPENVAIVKGSLESLDYMFSDDIVHVDVTSQNPARIWKLYGTMAKKGDSTPERPHRLAKLLDVSESFETVSKEQLDALKAMLPEPEEQLKTFSYTDGKGFDPVAYCQVHGLSVHHTKTYESGTLAVLENCIFDSSHKLSACIIGWPNGARTYRCRHFSCLDKHWKEAKAVIEPGEATSQSLYTQEPVEGTPGLMDIVKATGRITRVNPITGEDEPDPITGVKTVPKLTLSPSKAVSAIAGYMQLRLSSTETTNERLWRYTGTIWQPDGEKQVKNLVDKIIGDLSYERGLQETLRRLRGVSEAVAFDSNPYLFPALDKVIDLRTGIAREYQPEDHITFQYNVTVDNPAADCRIFLWAMCSSLPDPRDVLTVLDILTAIALRVPFEVIVLLFGRGNNSKGLLEKVIVTLFTMPRVTAIKLGEMKQSRFGPGALLGKDAWIVTEVETVRDAMSVLKAEASGEMIDSDVKHRGRVQGMPHAVSILDANNPFEFGDNSYGRKRRILKLDFPYTFGDDAGMRPIDRQLKDVKVVQPEVLSGIAQIIAARAPELIRTRRIYRRKGYEEQEDEFRRQQYSLSTFFESCIDTSWPFTKEDPEGETPKRLKVDDAYATYLEYCKLFNVTTPAEKVPFGKYIAEKYHSFSIVSSETVEGKTTSYRYYPQLFLVKSAAAVFGDSKLDFADIPYYSNYTTTTGLLQIWGIENSNSSDITTDTTVKVLSGAIEEIEKMYRFILSCKDERSITYENYLNFSVVSVVSDSSDPIIRSTEGVPPVVPVVTPNDIGEPIVPNSRDPNSTDAELKRAEADTAEKVPELEDAALTVDEVKMLWRFWRRIPNQPDAFKLAMALRDAGYEIGLPKCREWVRIRERTCESCGYQTPPGIEPFEPWFTGGKKRFCCTSCQIAGNLPEEDPKAPAKDESQTTFGDGEAKA